MPGAPFPTVLARTQQAFPEMSEDEQRERAEGELTISLLPSYTRSLGKMNDEKELNATDLALHPGSTFY